MSRYIFGAKGQVGSILSTVYPDAFRFAERVENKPAVVDFLAALDSDSVVFHAAALTDVEECERYPEKSYASNVLGVKHVVDAVNDAGATLVFFSSDYVFDGVRGRNSTKDIPNPVNVYGRHKLCAENYILSQVSRAKIIRTNAVYGFDPNYKNYAARVLSELRAGKEFRAATDEWVTPTNNVFLVNQVVKIAASNSEYGIFHVAGEEIVNRYDFACSVAEAAELNANLIKPVISSSLGRLARRPLNGGLEATHSCGTLYEGIFEMLGREADQN